MAENPYGLHNLPSVGGGVPGLPRREAATKAIPPRGESLFIVPGEHQWVCPPGVTSVCVVCVGAGGAGRSGVGTGGSLAWANDIPVIPGESYIILVDREDPSTGIVGSSALGRGAPSGIVVTTSSAYISPPPPYGEVGNDRGGGVGGAARRVSGSSVKGGGGGAGGYSGDGGRGGAGTTASLLPLNGEGGGGGGGHFGSVAQNPGADGGGVGLYGEGASGAAGENSDGQSGGRGGSGGTTGRPRVNDDLSGRSMFGGGMGETAPGWNYNKAAGAVRIVWGKGRSFPSNDVGPTWG